MIADKMLASLQGTAQLTHHARADMTALLTVKARFKAEGVSLSVEDLLMGALVQTLKQHPGINGTLQDREVHLTAAIDLCVAIALPGNLLAAPAIFTIFRTYKRKEYSAVADNGVWRRTDTGKTFDSLNQLNASIAAGNENVWNGNWKFKDSDGTIKSIAALRG